MIIPTKNIMFNYIQIHILFYCHWVVVNPSFFLCFLFYFMNISYFLAQQDASNAHPGSSCICFTQTTISHFKKHHFLLQENSIRNCSVIILQLSADRPRNTCIYIYIYIYIYIHTHTYIYTCIFRIFLELNPMIQKR